MANRPPPKLPGKELLSEMKERLLRYDLKSVALAAFAIGVLLHVCVALAILDGGGSKSTSTAPSQRAPGVSQNVAATPTRPADRTDCSAIRGTDYRSETERRWFLDHCSGGASP